MSAVQVRARLDAHEPPEARGAQRDSVRMLVSSWRKGSIVHGRFRDLPRFLAPGDLLVVNTSATLPVPMNVRRSALPHASLS
jgi:S-adenosylmethionine:tRNA ribosyltransferase-isomerase